jgi:hypothetical protein
MSTIKSRSIDGREDVPQPPGWNYAAVAHQGIVTVILTVIAGCGGMFVVSVAGRLDPHGVPTGVVGVQAGPTAVTA